MKMTLPVSDCLSLPKHITVGEHQTNSNGEASYKMLDLHPKLSRSKKQGKSEKFSCPRGALGGMMTIGNGCP